MKKQVWFSVGMAALTSIMALSTPTVASEGETTALDASSQATAIAPDTALQDLEQSSLVAQNAPRFPVIEFPPDGSVPRDGAFLGRGIAEGSKFSVGRQADAVLNFSNLDFHFTLSIAATVASDLEMIYHGTVVRKTTGTRGINSFILETQLDSFASSIGDYQVFEATGTCRIEIFDDLVVSSDCEVDDPPAMPVDLIEPGLSTQFFGVDQL